jgi:hypothetical protein
MLAKQVLSQLSYTPIVKAIFILKHFPSFCRFLFMFLGLDRARTVHLFPQSSHWTMTVHIGSAITGAFSPAWRLSFSRASRFICNFI